MAKDIDMRLKQIKCKEDKQSDYIIMLNCGMSLSVYQGTANEFFNIFRIKLFVFLF